MFTATLLLIAMLERFPEETANASAPEALPTLLMIAPPLLSAVSVAARGLEAGAAGRGDGARLADASPRELTAGTTGGEGGYDGDASGRVPTTRRQRQHAARRRPLATSMPAADSERR